MREGFCRLFIVRPKRARFHILLLSNGDNLAFLHSNNGDNLAFLHSNNGDNLAFMDSNNEDNLAFMHSNNGDNLAFMYSNNGDNLAFMYSNNGDNSWWTEHLRFLSKVSKHARHVLWLSYWFSRMFSISLYGGRSDRYICYCLQVRLLSHLTCIYMYWHCYKEQWVLCVLMYLYVLALL